jgi:hypothetical protein
MFSLNSNVWSDLFFLIQKKIIRTMMGINPISTCRPLFKNLRILTVPSQYILSLMKFSINNLEYITFNNITHTKFTRNRCLQVPQTCHYVTRGVYYMTTKVFNNVSKYIVDFVENETQFITKLKHLLIDQSL